MYKQKKGAKPQLTHHDIPKDSYLYYNQKSDNFVSKWLWTDSVCRREKVLPKQYSAFGLCLVASLT